MRYRYLGNTGIQVSELSFGTMTFGAESDEAASATLYSRCREAGINLFDCANSYQQGKAEEIFGKLIKKERDDLIITTKAFFPYDQKINNRGLSRRHLLQSIEESLTRLQTDYIDIFFMHNFDPHTQLEESLRTMQDLITQGKVRYFGISNFAAWQIMKTIGICQFHGWPVVQVIQPMYNLLKRQVEVEILPMAQTENLAVMPYNPLAGGMLSGKYLEGHEGRLLERKMYALRYETPENHTATETFVDFAKQRGFSPVSLAIAWVAAHPAVTSPILGARNLVQLDECLKSLEIPMSQELYDAVAALTPQPPLPTDRSDERLQIK